MAKLSVEIKFNLAFWNNVNLNWKLGAILKDLDRSGAHITVNTLIKNETDIYLPKNK